MTSPHAVQDTNRADPSFRPRSTMVQSRIDRGVSVDIERIPNWVFRASLLRWHSNIQTAIAHMRTVSVLEARLADNRWPDVMFRWHGQPGLARQLDPDLEPIVLARPATGLVARLTCFFSSIFRGTTKKQLPRLSSHNCRVTTY